MLADFLSNGMNKGANFMYPSAVDNFRRQSVPCPTCRLPLALTRTLTLTLTLTPNMCDSLRRMQFTQC